MLGKFSRKNLHIFSKPIDTLLASAKIRTAQHSTAQHSTAQHSTSFTL